jgi:hypothetical protein
MLKKLNLIACVLLYTASFAEQTDSVQGQVTSQTLQKQVVIITQQDNKATTQKAVSVRKTITTWSKIKDLFM